MENGVKIILADSEIIRLCNDKWETYQLMKRINVGTPKTYLKLPDLLSAVRSGEIQYPVMIKPRWGMGSIGIYSVDNEEELRVLSSKCSRDIMNTYLKYESAYTSCFTGRKITVAPIKRRPRTSVSAIGTKHSYTVRVDGNVSLCEKSPKLV
jgi:carbamoylphosphate synthase large subunit